MFSFFIEYNKKIEKKNSSEIQKKKNHFSENEIQMGRGPPTHLYVTDMNHRVLKKEMWHFLYRVLSKATGQSLNVKRYVSFLFHVVSITKYKNSHNIWMGDNILGIREYTYRRRNFNTQQELFKLNIFGKTMIV